MNKVIGKKNDIIRKVEAGSVKLRRNIKNYPILVEQKKAAVNSTSGVKDTGIHLHPILP
jgi:hypothetical protein